MAEFTDEERELVHRGIDTLLAGGPRHSSSDEDLARAARAAYMRVALQEREETYIGWEQQPEDVKRAWRAVVRLVLSAERERNA